MKLEMLHHRWIAQMFSLAGRKPKGNVACRSNFSSLRTSSPEALPNQDILEKRKVIDLSAKAIKTYESQNRLKLPFYGINENNEEALEMIE